MTFGILQRYVFFEVFRAFALALLTMTVIFVLFMVMAEAAKLGLSPADVLTLAPLVVPSTLAYTAPVSILFAVSVVYGRLASDNEIIAVKTAGLSAMTMIWPSVLFGGALTATLLFLSGDAVPRSNFRARLAIYKNLEEMIYGLLKKDREVNIPKWPYLIKVKDVKDKVLIDATFKHRTKGTDNPNAFDMTVIAKKARLEFDTAHSRALVHLEHAEILELRKGDVALIHDRPLEIPFPDSNAPGFDRRIQEWTTAGLIKEQAQCLKLIALERKRQAITAALGFGSGRFRPDGSYRIDWPGIQSAFVNYSYWNRRVSEFETEKQLRVAQSFGSIVFVLLGAPVGILFARRDFLSAFISCFLPIILLYYPLMLLGVNMGKEEILNPTVALWAGNLFLAVLAGFALPPVIRH